MQLSIAHCKFGLDLCNFMSLFSLSDLNTIYNSVYFDPTRDVKSLQRKVQWDIRYYFTRRGAENIHGMEKDHFIVMTDRKSGLRYVVKAKDEETKNHKEVNQDIISGLMPEIKDSKICPVSSYIRYVNALSPKSKKLWQTAKFKDFPNDEASVLYYGNMGHNKLDNFVADVCQLLKEDRRYNFDKRYTNHCLRVTAITNLTRENYNNKQIMSVTGHKSSASLEIYQKVNNKEKLQMGQTLAESLTDQISKKRKASSTTTRSDQPPAKMPLVEIPNEHDPDFNFSVEDILSIVEQCEKASEDYAISNVNNNNNNQFSVISNVLQPRRPNIPSFNNCKIGNITINIQK